MDPAPQRAPRYEAQQRPHDRSPRRDEQEGPASVPKWAAPRSPADGYGREASGTDVHPSQPPSGTARAEAPGGAHTNAKDAPLSGQATLLILGLVYAAWALAGNQEDR